MKRRDFLKITAPLTLAPLTLNGLNVNGINNLMEFNELLTSDEFKDRHVVVLQMRGANDALNTIIPVDQYDGYANARTNIHIPETYLTTELDTSLPDEKRAYLHPEMVGTNSIQALYDEGKVNIIHGIGYPTPNYSHFRSTDLLLSGKDGNFQVPVRQGWFADYLSSVYPSFTGQPTVNLPHPLGIQLGDNSSNMGYRHEQLHNVGVNITSRAETLYYSQLGVDTHHYNELLDYVQSIDNAAETYNQVIDNAFENGNNSYSYPNSYLGRQLKTFARLLSGGIQSKLLLADLVGFDTHVSQVTDSGSGTLTGRHANLLSQFSDAVYSFQKDIEALGLADKVVLVTMSEFGRKIKENNNKGTDHGDLSSWMVIGNGVKAGVTGRNIDLREEMIDAAGRTKDVIQYDYRRLLSTVIQDWLGSSDVVLSEMETDDAVPSQNLLAFGGANKLDIFKNGVAVTPNDQVDEFGTYRINIRNLVPIQTVGGWTYYAEADDSNNTIYFGVEHKPTGGNTSNISPTISVYNLIDDGVGNDYFSATSEKHGNFILGDFWNIDIGGDILSGFVNIRFFVDPTKIAALQNAATAFKTAQSSNYMSGQLWIQTEDPTFFDPQSQIRYNGLSQAISSLGSKTPGTYNSRTYFQFDEIIELGNRGGGMSIHVTNVDGIVGGEIGAYPAFNYPQNPEPGTLIYNHSSGKFEGWNGLAWVTLNNF